VARNKDPGLNTYYFGRMVEMYQFYHRKFAADKFPAFSGKPPVIHVH
jgi:hypothetical protein